MHVPQVLPNILQLATPIVPTPRSNGIKEKGGAPNLMEMDDMIKG
jgi:hypothetical protein